MGQVHKELCPTAIARVHIGHLNSVRLDPGPGRLLGNPYYQCPILTQGSFSQATLRRSPQSFSLQVGSRASILLFNSEHASACRPSFSSARAAVGTAVQSRVHSLHMRNWAFCLFLFLAQSSLQLASIFLLAASNCWDNKACTTTPGFVGSQRKLNPPKYLLLRK